MLYLCLQFLCSVILAGVYFLLFLKFLGKYISPKKTLVESAQPLNKDIRVFIGTWNVGDTTPADDLSNWLGSAKDCEIVAIGTQECFYNAVNVEADFYGRVGTALGQQFELIASTSVRDAIRIGVFAHASLKNTLSSVQYGYDTFGLPVMQRKGIVGVALEVGGTQIAFANMHLEAHMPGNLQRNICSSYALEHFRLLDFNKNLASHFDHVFVFGDLNYRIEKFTKEEILAVCDDTSSAAPEKFVKLLSADQLKHQLTKGGVFDGFAEAEITFNPTFKYKKRSLKYDLQRSPAWCDRIVHRHKNPHSFEQRSYFCAEKVQSSDHLPVGAVFDLHSLN